MPDSISNGTAMLTAIGTFVLAIFGRSAIDKDIRTLRADKVDKDRFEDFKKDNGKAHDGIQVLLEKMFDKLDDIRDKL